MTLSMPPDSSCSLFLLKHTAVTCNMRVMMMMMMMMIMMTMVMIMTNSVITGQGVDIVAAPRVPQLRNSHDQNVVNRHRYTLTHTDTN